ncbi:elongation factor G [Ferrimonas senticii]|uniref:elongation factor G n=1 Tax=Ferrimonas senticii TaxID=394566 RepID=UPI0003F7C6E7|nr:elongation factor G [Ferrimonas senticii]
MPALRTEQIRNVALLGHAGSGKSSLIEALLYRAKAIPTHGRVDDGTNHADFTAQEQQHHHSLEPSLLNLNYYNCHVNLIDTPGLVDLFGRAQLTLPAVESVLLVINAERGIEQVTRRAFSDARRHGKAVILVINRISDNLDKLEALLENIQLQFGHGCLPVNLPSVDGKAVLDCYFTPQYDDGQPLFSEVKACHDALVDVVVEQDEALMEIYLEQEQSLTPEQLHNPLEAALRQGELVPICFTDAEAPLGIGHLLNLICQGLPNPLEGSAAEFVNRQQQPVAISGEAQDHLLAHVFKMSIDPYLGRLGVCRVHQGRLFIGQKLFIGEDRKPVKISHLYQLQGGQQTPVNEALPGDICALAKLEGLEIGAILHDHHEEDQFSMVPPELPQPIFGLAVRPKKRGDEQKLAEVLQKLVTEDPSLQIRHEAGQNQTVLQGLGDTHVQIALEKAVQVFKLDMETDVPAVAYRETVQGTGIARYRHKKQTGGAGQFGEVELRVETLPRGSGFQFASEVVGGAIPSQFIPAIEKGVREAMTEGVLAGFAMQDLKVVVMDGKHHPVDSKEIAFFTAGKKAFLEAVLLAKPALLEPIVELLVTVNQDKVGDITGDLASHRAMVCGTEAKGNNQVEIAAEAPLAELDDYSVRLKAMTGGEAELSMAFARYEVAPEQLTERLRQH